MIWSIQYLRFFACLMVVTLHLTKKSYLNNGDGYLYFGASGVDIFFIISGFIMSYISNKKETTSLDFIKNRTLRIYPIYLITLIPFLGIFLAYPSIVNTHSLPPSIIKSITLLPFLSGGSLNMVSWTLSYEFYFYIIYAISLSIGKNAIRNSSIIIMTMLFLGHIFKIRFISSMISLEFVFGMFIYEFIYNKVEVGIKKSILLMLTGLCWIVFSSKAEVGGDDIIRVLYYGIPSALIFIGFLSTKIFSKKINKLVLLGDASYAIYLTHILTINAVYLVFKRIGMQETLYLPMIIIGVSLSIAIGLVVHLMIEKPVTKKLKSYPFFISKSTPINS
ncbi:acyltransferase family protein [Tatumella terrea]|uniref:Acyltransferase family protein n=1 Tax=Tatumella terrea TaxID=419007 RepID=A0ABW1VTK1_9GAMM